MGIWELLVLGGAVAMDATAVSLCKGPCVRPEERYKMWVLPLFFGIFQMGMPLIGYRLGASVTSYLHPYDAWAAGALLGYLGLSMIRNGWRGSDEVEACTVLSWREMLVLAFATSIDAMAVGAGLAFVAADAWTAALCMGGVTFLASVVGMYTGRRVGDVLNGRGELLGGVALLGIAISMILS